MKKLMLAAAATFGSIAFVNAQDSTAVQRQTQTEMGAQDQERQKIEISELPDAVKSALESQDYKGWNISAAYKATEINTVDDQAVQDDPKNTSGVMEVYYVELKNGAETKTLKFDKEGKRLDDNKEDDQ